MDFVDEDDVYPGGGGENSSDPPHMPTERAGKSEGQPVISMRRRRLDSDSESGSSTGSDSDDSDAAPQRRKETLSTTRPVHSRDGVESDSDSDADPRRKRANDTSSDDDDASPPRRNSTSLPQPRKDSRFVGGLISGAEFAKNQTALEEQRKSISKDIGGKAMGSQDVVHRNRNGKIIDIQQSKRQREAAKKKEEYLWGTGRRQREELLKKFDHIQKISKAPFSQFADDTAGMRDAELRNRIRVEDPMANFSAGNKEDGSSKNPSSKSKKIYKGPPAPANRYGIQPGYRWDGVNRGNGFEAKVIENIRKKRKR